MSFQSQVLVGRWVQLEPLSPAHREPLRVAADDERIWRHTIEVARGPVFDLWFDQALAEQQADRRIPFAVRHLPDSRLIGSTSYLDVVERHRRVEIGSTWYAHQFWGTTINPECKFLLLKHAFEVLGINRVALITDRMNERSKAAIAKLGAIREGVLRNHMVVQEGRLRDSVVFSILSSEWPTVRALLQSRLGYQ